MKHYICTGGCEGVSETPGTCQALACPKNMQPLTECDCEDGKHQQHATMPLQPEEREAE